jgi:hypothetical protein
MPEWVCANFQNGIVTRAKGCSAMSDAYVIEVQGIEAGIIVRKHQTEENYKFLSVVRAFNDLEGQEFASPFQAECAARKLLRDAPYLKNQTSAKL